MEYEHSFISKPVLRPEYGNLLGHQGYLMQGLSLIYLFVALELAKEKFWHPQSNCNNWG